MTWSPGGEVVDNRTTDRPGASGRACSAHPRTQRLSAPSSRREHRQTNTDWSPLLRRRSRAARNSSIRADIDQEAWKSCRSSRPGVDLDVEPVQSAEHIVEVVRAYPGDVEVVDAQQEPAPVRPGVPVGQHQVDHVAGVEVAARGWCEAGDQHCQWGCSGAGVSLSGPGCSGASAEVLVGGSGSRGWSAAPVLTSASASAAPGRPCAGPWSIRRAGGDVVPGSACARGPPAPGRTSPRRRRRPRWPRRP